MTNVQIIDKEKAANGIKEEVNTYEGWKRNGMQVQKGQKALFKTMIWKPVTKKKADSEVVEADEDGKDKMIMVKAAFFGISQVESK